MKIINVVQYVTLPDRILSFSSLRHRTGGSLDLRGGSAALLSLFDGLDLLDPFEVTRDFLLQKRLKDQVRQRGLGVQQNLLLDLKNRRSDASERRNLRFYLAT